MVLEFSRVFKNAAVVAVTFVITGSLALAESTDPSNAFSASKTKTEIFKAEAVKDNQRKIAPGGTSDPLGTSDEAPVGQSIGELSTTAGNPFSWKKSKETKLGYKFVSGFDSFANEKEQSQFFGLGVKVDGKAELSPSLSARLKASAIVSTGYAQSQFGDNVGKSGFYLQEALMNWRLMDTSIARLYLSGGAIDQGQFEAPLFIDKNAFPGLKQTLILGNSKEFKIKVWAQQTIPVSKNLSTKAIDAEVTPSFYSETASLEVKPFEALKLDAGVTHFAFNNLPSATALESVSYGNTVTEIGPNSSRFKFGFNGVMAQAGINVLIAPRFSWDSRGYAVQNMAADEGYRNAQLIQTGFKIGLPGEVDLTPSIATFFSEDDAVPGFYNSSRAGHNNRKGMAAKVEVFFQRQRFKVESEFVDAELINPNINQSRQQSLFINFETFYELL